MAREPMRLAVLVGTKGRGSNLFALFEAIQQKRLAATLSIVIGSRADAPAIVRARDAGIPVAIVPVYKEDLARYEDELRDVLHRHNVDTIALAGYLRRLPPLVVADFAQRIVNIHPSLLPAFGGKGMYGEHVHRAVIEHGCKVSGCTVHLTDEGYDSGPIVLQRVVSVEENDTAETLAARILPHEHAALIDALILLADDRLIVEGRRVRIRQKEES